MNRLFLAAALSALVTGTACENGLPVSHTLEQLKTVRVVTPDDVDYQPLHPARGDASPQAGV